MAAGNPGSPIKQAQAAANAAVQTRGSINQQYGQSIQDATGFTRALMSLLNGMPGAAAGYAPAIAQQTAIGNAAAGRIAAVTGGMPTSASSGAAVGGLADSALSHLVANQAAAKTMQSQLPYAAAARGALADQSLITARNQALQQRNQQYSQAFQSALSQARQQAEVMREFGINTGLRQQQIQLQAQNQAQNNAYRYAALAQNQSQFKQAQAQHWQETLARLQASIHAGSAPGLAGLSPSQVASYEKQGSSYSQSAILHGLPIQIAIRNMVAQNIPRSVAMVQAQLEYANASKPTKNEFTMHAGTSNATFNKNGYNAALRSYQKVMASFASWINNQKFRAALHADKYRSKPPGHPE